jgi:isopenicillin-N epimerase
VRAGTPWSLDPSVVFLNHGSFGACPQPVLEAQSRWRARLEAQPLRFLGRELDGLMATARQVVADALHADPDGLAFLPNATTGVSTVLASLRFEPGDELLSTDHEYNATLNALGEAARRDRAQVVLARIPFPIGSAEDALAAIVDAVTARTRLALVSHVTSPTALVLPIDRIVAALAERGVDTLVDAAHAPGMVAVDVDALGAAYWVGNGHKWLCGPKGTGMLWVRHDRRDRVDPLVISHGWNDERVERGERTPFRARFDWLGTTDPTPYIALADAIAIVGAFEPGGWPALMAANRRLAIGGRDRVATALGVRPPAPDAMTGSMAALPVPGAHSDADAEALHGALLEAGFEVPVHGWPVRAACEAGEAPRRVVLRISAQRYNEPADYDRLAGALTRLAAAAAG